MTAIIKNSQVINFVSQVERQALTAIQKCATERPDASRLFSIAVAIERLVKAILLAPAVFLEKIILIGKSVKDYLTTSSQQQKKLHLDECKAHAVSALKTFFVGVPVSLISNVVLAIADSIKAAKNPLQFANHQIEKIKRDSSAHDSSEDKLIGNSLADLAEVTGGALRAAGCRVDLS